MKIIKTYYVIVKDSQPDNRLNVEENKTKSNKVLF